MANLRRNALRTLAAVFAAVSIASASTAQDLTLTASATKAGRSLLATPVLQSWMNPDVGLAWRNGYFGKGTTITVVDDFTSPWGYSGNLGLGPQVLRHGEWTRQEASMIAPLATIKSKDFSTGSAVSLARGLNVLNLSYGMYAIAGYSASQIRWGRQEASIISYATKGQAVISKAAGNDAVAVGTATTDGQMDYLDLALIGTKSAIFVGALDANGTPENQASLAAYSNFAGDNLAVQKQFLVVGVEGDKTGLYGTSFAAPIVTGYAAILGSKFTTATPTDIANKLLTTARTDTLLNYSATTYGQGEASLSRALAPLSIK